MNKALSLLVIAVVTIIFICWTIYYFRKSNRRHKLWMEEYGKREHIYKYVHYKARVERDIYLEHIKKRLNSDTIEYVFFVFNAIQTNIDSHILCLVQDDVKKQYGDFLKMNNVELSKVIEQLKAKYGALT